MVLLFEIFGGNKIRNTRLEGWVEYRWVYNGFTEFWLSVFSMAWYKEEYPSSLSCIDDYCFKLVIKMLFLTYADACHDLVWLLEMEMHVLFWQEITVNQSLAHWNSKG